MAETDAADAPERRSDAAARPAAARGAGAGDPGAEVEALKKQIAELEAQESEIGTRRGDLEERLGKLETRLAATRKVTDAYDKGRADLDAGRAELAGYLQTKKRMVGAAVGERRREVERAVAEADAGIEYAAGEVERLRVEAQGLARRRTEAEKRAESARQRLAEVGGWGTSLGARLAAARSLRNKIDAYDQEGKLLEMSFLLDELEALLADLVPPKPEFVAKRHLEASQEVEAAQAAAAAAGRDADEAGKRLAESQAKLAKLREARRQTILDHLAKAPDRPAEPERPPAGDRGEHSPESEN